jgi:hypothetical protein
LPLFLLPSLILQPQRIQSPIPDVAGGTQPVSPVDSVSALMETPYTSTNYTHKIKLIETGGQQSVAKKFINPFASIQTHL